MSSSTRCEFGACNGPPDYLVYSEEWGNPTSRRMCDRHAQIARVNDAYEVVSAPPSDDESARSAGGGAT